MNRGISLLYRHFFSSTISTSIAGTNLSFTTKKKPSEQLYTIHMSLQATIFKDKPSQESVLSAINGMAHENLEVYSDSSRSPLSGNEPNEDKSTDSCGHMFRRHELRRLDMESCQHCNEAIEDILYVRSLCNEKLCLGHDIALRRATGRGR